MKGTDTLRAILDIIDSLDSEKNSHTDYLPADSEEARLRRITDFLTAGEKTGFDNQPNEIVASLKAVTDHAGGGVNAPKHPDDIRVKDPRGYE